MRIEWTYSPDGQHVIVDNQHGTIIYLDADEAFELLVWLYGERGDLARLINGLDREPKTFLQETRPDKDTRFNRNY